MPTQPSILLTQDPLDVAAALKEVTCPDAGGIDIFVGSTRTENHPELGDLLHLDYHAYPEMAVKRLSQLARDAAEKWPIARMVVWHRLGKVAVGEASVIIAVSCPHRAGAFEACRFMIDSLKKDVSIWKKE